MIIERIEIWRVESLELILPTYLECLAHSPDVQVFKNLSNDIYTLKIFPSLLGVDSFIIHKALYVPCKFKHGVFKLETRCASR